MRRWKIVVIVLVVLALAGGSAYWFLIRPNLAAQSAQSSVTVVKVSKGNVVESISLSGTVSNEGQINVSSKASGKVVSVAVQVGQTVPAGAELMRLDVSSMDSDVALARISLESAQLKLQQLQEPPADSDLAPLQLSLEKAKSDLEQAQASRSRAQQSVDLALEIAQGAVDKANADRQAAQDSLEQAKQNAAESLKTAQDSLEQAKQNAAESLKAAQDGLEQAKQNAAMSLASAQTAVTNAEADLDDATDAMDQASKKTAQRNLESAQQKLDSQQLSNEQSIQAAQQKLDSQQLSNEQSIQAAQQKLDSQQLSNEQSIQAAQQKLQSAEVAITDAEKSLEQRKLTNQDSLISADNQVSNAQVSIQQAQNSLDAKLTPASATDLQLQQMSVDQAQLNLQKLLDQQAESVLKAPIAGAISAINVGVGDMISTSAAAFVMVSQDSLSIVANVPEVSVADLHTGLPASVSADAFPDKTFTATLATLSPFATESQGVVSYETRFTTTGTSAQLLRQGMSVQLTVVTAQANNVLLVPRTAIQSLNGRDLVLVKTPSGSRAQPVQVGLQDDTMAEIKSGLSESDQVAVSSSSSSATLLRQGLMGLNIFGIGGIEGGGPPGGAPGGSRPGGAPGGSRPSGATAAPGGG